MKKKNKLIRTLITVVILAIVCCGGTFAVDYNQCAKQEKPIFVIPSDDVDSSDTGTYNGIFYSCKIVARHTMDYASNTTAVVVDSTEMYLFGKLIVKSPA